MKNRKENKRQYKQLINKLFVKTILLFIAAILMAFLIRSLVQGRMGNAIMRVLQEIYGLDSGAAEMAYHYKIRQHYDLIIAATVIIFFAVFYKMFLTWFTKYFDELITGIRGIEKREQIKLSEELHFIEVTMNQIKDQLIENEEEKRLTEERKNDLVVYLAHDIRTPLTSVIGYLDLLEDSQEGMTEEQKHYIHITKEKANRLEKLIDEFFEITKYNTNAVPIKKEEIDLGYMMVQIVDEAYPALKEKEKQVELSIPNELTIFADAEKLSRVFNNILKNAIY